MGLIKTLAKTYYQTNFWDCEILVDDHLFCSSIIVLQDSI